MKLNAMLTKNQIICCGMINLSFLEFQRLTAAGGCDRSLPVAEGRGTKVVGDGVLAPPHLRVGRKLRHRRERTPQFAVIPAQIEPRPEAGEHEHHKLAKPIAEVPLVAGLRRITTRDRLEVFSRPASHIEDVRRWRPDLERAALVIFPVLANATDHIDPVPAPPSASHAHPPPASHDI